MSGTVTSHAVAARIRQPAAQGEHRRAIAEFRARGHGSRHPPSTHSQSSVANQRWFGAEDGCRTATRASAQLIARGRAELPSCASWAQRAWGLRVSKGDDVSRREAL
jgi:hypothetical protein